MTRFRVLPIRTALSHPRQISAPVSVTKFSVESFSRSSETSNIGRIGSCLSEQVCGHHPAWLNSGEMKKSRTLDSHVVKPNPSVSVTVGAVKSVKFEIANLKFPYFYFNKVVGLISI